MKIASVVGARPNFVKLAPVSRELRKEFEEIIIHTGQHYNYELDKIFFDDLGIPAPDYHLSVGSGGHGCQTGEMIKRIEDVLLKEKPDLALVFGDTNSTLAGALAAAKMQIPVAHVEAGLRSFDRKMPEEVNRVLVDHCSDMLFCPTQRAAENLKREGITEGVSLTGDVMVDIFRDCIKVAEENSRILDELELDPGEYCLATVHRASNTDDPSVLGGIIEAFEEIGNVVLPCHPRTEKYLMKYDFIDRMKNTRIIKPVGYLDMLALGYNSAKILTDSGGLQKEAYMLGVPCITLRESTEWVETVEDGWNVLVGSKKERIVLASKAFCPRSTRTDVFGDGNSSLIINRNIIEKLNI